jgi:hypothetical protein
MVLAAHVAFGSKPVNLELSICGRVCTRKRTSLSSPLLSRSRGLAPDALAAKIVRTCITEGLVAALLYDRN